MQTQVKHKGEKNKDKNWKSGQHTRGMKLKKRKKTQEGSPPNPKS